MTLKEEFQTRNFSIYGQWLGILSMIICLAVGIANIFSFNPVRIIFCALAMYDQPTLSTNLANRSSASAFIILFIEVPLLLRICPTSGKFDELIRKISTNYMRAGAYGVMSTLQFVSNVSGASSLIAAAVFLLLTALCYLLAGIKGQAFVGSKTLGGQGVAQMIV
ncbi:golgi apparatus membrane tvp18 [Fusarium albosuccineum]|uniref:Golgi apparatus membrane tvp18 n=1 Tax=Fusarium albosuccineum TaxID=1237068 RepID=A0A8H4KZF4_9HYPO|nr:golgi apparatus membrane tvp18 [Fusarium albosuccineum]